MSNELKENQYVGIVKYWNYNRAYGFLSYKDTDGETKDCFAHLNDTNLKNTDRTPRIGDEVSFCMIKDNLNRNKAIEIVFPVSEVDVTVEDDVNTSKKSIYSSDESGGD